MVSQGFRESKVKDEVLSRKWCVLLISLLQTKVYLSGILYFWRAIRRPGIKLQCSFRDLGRFRFAVLSPQTSVIWEWKLLVSACFFSCESSLLHVNCWFSAPLSKPVTSQCPWVPSSRGSLFADHLCLCVVGELPLGPPVTQNLGFLTCKMWLVITCCLFWWIQWHSNNLHKAVVQCLAYLKASKMLPINGECIELPLPGSLSKTVLSPCYYS